MTEKRKAVVLLVPGFPANEQDTTCIPFLQQFCKGFITVSPEVELRIISFQYPYKKGHYAWNGIEVYAAAGKGNKLNRITTWLRVFKEFSQIRKENDVVIINSFWMTECAFVGQWLSRFFKIKHVVYIAGQDALKTNRYLPFINFKNIKIIAMSENLVNEFYKSTAVKIEHIIPSGIDTSKLKPTNEKRSIDILGVGALTQLKNYLLFAEIIKELKIDFPEIKACIIGKGEQGQTLMDYISNNNLENNLTLTGELSHTEVFTYMQKSKLFLHTSGYEGQSTVIMEALANGLTVVCFDIGRAHVEGKIWPCKNKEEMIEKLKELMAGKLTFEPFIQSTNMQMASAFLKVYEI